MFCVPKVAINAGIFSFATRIPLNSPAKPPARTDNTIAAAAGIPIFIKSTHNTDTVLIIDPTDKSVPWVIITSVCPNAKTRSGAAVIKKVLKLLPEKKPSTCEPKNITNMKIIQTAGGICANFFLESAFIFIHSTPSINVPSLSAENSCRRNSPEMLPFFMT